MASPPSTNEETPPTDDQTQSSPSDNSSSFPPPQLSKSSSTPSSNSSDESQPPPPPSPPSKDDSSSSPPKNSDSSSSPPKNSDSSSSPSESSPSSESSPPPPKSSSPPSPHSKSSSSPPSGNSGLSSPPPPLHDTTTRDSTNNGMRSSHPAIDSSSNSSSSFNMSDKTMIIAGVAAGGLIVLIIAIVCCMVCRGKKKRNQERRQANYFNDNANEAGGSEYYQSTGQWQNNKDHALKMPTAPPSQYSSGQWSGMGPPPPPPGLYSSEMGYSSGMTLPPPHPALALGFNKSTFSYDDLSVATGGFAKENLLGQGGFGYVHKGVLPNGKEVAVKSLKANSGQGEREFQAEVDIISRVHHKHLVSLVGYCIADTQRMLVYEFVPNMSLEDHLYGSGMPVMNFQTRLRIALGSAKGFAYLHEDCHPRIIHRDIKAANILLDHNYEAKVADFGLAKLSNDTQTHVSTRIMGTFGYLAPEYASSGKLTEKSDVFSYGVVLLELITGKRPVDMSGDDDNLVDWARPILVDAVDGGSYEELVDPKLGDDYSYQEMLCMVAVAAACVRHSAKRRPRMSQVVRALEGDANLEDLNNGERPGHSGLFGSSGGSEDSYGSGVRRVRPKSGAAASSNEFSSSEHTGEYEADSHTLPKKRIT